MGEKCLDKLFEDFLDHILISNKEEIEFVDLSLSDAISLQERCAKERYIGYNSLIIPVMSVKLNTTNYKLRFRKNKNA